MKKHEFNFQRWCRIATEKILYKPDRKVVYKELRDHLEDAYDACIAKGITPDEAEAKVLETMGKAEDIAPQLAAIHKPFWGFVLQTCQILLIVLLCLSILPLWDYATDLNLGVRNLRDFELYDSASYGGDTGRTLHHLSQPEASFSCDGNRFTLTNAVLFTADKEDGTRGSTQLYVRIRQTSQLPWTECESYLGRGYETTRYWFHARDSLGNVYDGNWLQSNPDLHYMYSRGMQSGIFTYTHECWINEFPADAEWVEICYERDGRKFALHVDLTGGDGK